MFEAYKIGVRISLVNTASAGLLSLSKDFRTAHNSAAKLEERLGAIKGLMMTGGIMAAGGIGMLSMFKAPIEAAKEYELTFSKFKTLNFGDAINLQADKFARGSNVIGVSAKQLMTTLSEATGIFGSFEVAKEMTPKLASLNAANSAIFHGKVGEMDEGSIRALIKFTERRGQEINVKNMSHNLDLAEKMVTGSGGFIQFKDLDQFSQRAGTAFRGLSDDGIFNMSLPIQEIGGSGAGNAWMSMYQNLIAGRTPVKTMALLEKFHLAKMAMQDNGTVGGKSSKHLVMTEIKDADLLQSNPGAWVAKDLLPALSAAGITDNATILKYVNDFLSNRNASKLGSLMSLQQLQMIRDSDLAKNAMGADQVIKQYHSDPNSKFADLQSKFNGLMVNLGIVVLPMVIKALDHLIPMIKSLSDWIKEHRTATKYLAATFIALGAAMAIGGTVVLLTAGFKGLGLVLGGMRSISSVATDAVLALNKLPTAIKGVGAAALAAYGIAVGYEAISKFVKGEDASNSASRFVDGAFRLVGMGDNQTIGGAVFDMIHKPHTQTPQHPLTGHFNKASANQSPFIGGGNKNTPVVQVTNHFDKNGIATMVAGAIAKSMNKPQTGIFGFDATMSPLTPAMR